MNFLSVEESLRNLIKKETENCPKRETRVIRAVDCQHWCSEHPGNGGYKSSIELKLKKEEEILSLSDVIIASVVFYALRADS